MRSALAFATVLALSFSAYVPLPARAADSIQAVIDRRVAAHSDEAIIGAVMDHDGVHTYAAGSTGNARPLDEHTLFEIGSVTKTFTATVLSEMTLAHKVSLNEPVARLLPSRVRVPSRDGKQITLLTLAEQNSGLPRLPNNMKTDGDDPYVSYTVRDLYAFLNRYHLPRDPGAKFEYSNLGVGLLGYALARDNHMSYEQMVRSYVWKPLGMNETRIALGPTDEARFAVGHDEAGGAVHSWEFTDADAGAGAIRSDLHDMLAYLRAAMGRGPLANAMTFAEKPRATMGANYRIGLVWWNDTKYHLIQHGGDTAGYHAMVMMTADRSRGAVFLSNGPMVSDLAGRALDPSYPLTHIHAAKLSDAQLDEYLGTYANTSEGIRYTIARREHQLVAQIAGQPAAVIYASRPDHFFYTIVPAYLEFVRHDGKIVGLVLTQNGQSLGAPKLGDDGKPMVAEVVPDYPPVVTLDAPTLQSYVGTYGYQGTTLTVSVNDGHVFARIQGQHAYEIYPSAKDQFYYKIVDALVHFNRDARGEVTSLTLSQNGYDIPYTKKP